MTILSWFVLLLAMIGLASGQGCEASNTSDSGTNTLRACAAIGGEIKVVCAATYTINSPITFSTAVPAPVIKGLSCASTPAVIRCSSAANKGLVYAGSGALFQGLDIQGCNAGFAFSGAGSTGNTVDRNRITGGTTGILIESGAANNVITSNTIGLDSSNNVSANTGNGIHINAANTNTIKENIIAGNQQDGILISNGATSNVIDSNKVGVDSGLVSKPNAGRGVHIQNASNSNTLQKNIIKNNTVQSEVTIDTATSILVTENEIIESSGAPLALTTGANGLATSALTINAIAFNGSNLDVTISATNVQPVTYTVEFFNGTTAFGGGPYIHTTTVVSSGTSITNAVVQLPLSKTNASNTFISFTLTNSGATSKYSNGFQLPSPSPSISFSSTISITPSSTPTISVSGSISVTPSITPSSTPSISVSGSISITASTSPSGTASLSVGASPSGSASASISASSSVSTSTSVSVSPSASSSLSASISPSPSASSLLFRPVHRRITATSIKVSWKRLADFFIQSEVGPLIHKWELEMQRQTNAPSDSPEFGDWQPVEIQSAKKVKENIFEGLESNTFYMFRVRGIDRSGSAVTSFTVTVPIRTGA